MKKSILVFMAVITLVVSTLAQTETLNLRGTAKISSICLDEEKIFVGAYNSGFYVYDFQANTETKISAPFDSYTISKNDSYYFLPKSNAVLLYNKDKKNHQELAPLPSNIIRSFAADNSKLVIGLYGTGVIYADIQKYSFLYKNKNLGYPDVTNVSIYQDSILLATTHSGGFFISPFDSTSEWKPKNKGLDNTIINLLTHNNQSIYVVIGANKLYRSNDLGENWERINFPTPNIIVSIKMLGQALWVATKNNGLYMSLNNGGSWSNINNFDKEISISSFDINSKVIAVGTEEDGLLWTKNLGNIWEEKTFKIGQDVIAVRKILNTGKDMFVGTEKDGIFFSSNKGNKFASTGFLNPGDFIFDMTEKQQKIFAASLYGGIYKSTDYGATWKSANIEISSKRTTRLTWIDDTLVAATNGGGVNISTNWGESWTQRNSGLGFKYLAAVHYNNGRLFAASFGGGLYYSDDNGFNWKKATGIPDEYTIRLRSEGNNLYLGTSEGLYTSSDNGNNWVKGKLEGAIYDMLAFDEYVFVAVFSTGLYLSRDKGLTYELVKEYKGDYEMLCLSMDKDYLYICTLKGLYRLKFSTLNITSVPEDKLVTKNEPFDIFPNPCRDVLFFHSKDETTYKYIDIYDLNGLLLIRNAINHQPEIKLDIGNLPNGAYYIKAGTSGKIFIKE